MSRISRLPLGPLSLQTELSQKLLKDSRDWPFIKTIAGETFILLPFALYLFTQREISWITGLIYLALVIFFMGPHLLRLHNICHRNPWKTPCKKMFSNIHDILGLLFGLAPSVYFHHHIKMHHREENGPGDLSSTEKYQRDSFAHWLIYFFRFALFNPIELPLYFFRKKRKDFAQKVIVGYLIFFGTWLLGFLINPTATWWVLIVPSFICWFGLMGGNWAQHAFIDQKDPTNAYKNSITLVGGLYNKRCFNDGHHIAHHLYPVMHWTELPNDFENKKEEYLANGGIIFKGLDFQMVWLFLMLKRWDLLAKNSIAKLNSSELTFKMMDLTKKIN